MKHNSLPQQCLNCSYEFACHGECPTDCVAWPHSENGEVLSVEDGKARVQGSGVVKFTVGKAGTAREVEIDFAQAAVQEIWF